MAISFETDRGGRTVAANEQSSLADLAQEAKLFLNTRCAGNGSCGGCGIILKSGTFSVDGKLVTVSVADKPKKALACRTQVIGDEAVVEVPPSSLIEIYGKIEDDFQLHNYVHDAQTKKFCLFISDSEGEDAPSDRDRIEVELAKQTSLKNIYMPLDALQKIPGALAQGEGRITITLGRIRSYWFIVNIQPHDTTGTHLALAVDIGTTTVVAILVDLTAGAILARGSCYNQQISKADDVASRISYCKSQKRVEQMQRLVVEDTLNVIIRGLCEQTGCDAGQINRMVISGNTVMSHLFLGISPSGIGRLPFRPVTRVPGEYLAKDMGVGINPHGIIDVIPAIAGYLGGDITSDIYSANILENPGLTLLVDIGTNGEIVLAENGELTACATAAGPAFEGAGILHGCRAATGAIEHIALDDELKFQITVIGGEAAVGLCGSALIDFFAVGMSAGLISQTGRFDIERLRELNLYREIELKNAGGKSHACLLVDKSLSATGEDIVITEADLSKIMQAKAAIYAGMKTLLALRYKRFGDIQRFILAGGFARHIDIPHAIRMGLLPEIPLDRIEVIGNGSLAGAFLALLEPDALKSFREIIERPQVVELNTTEYFNNNYVDALFLPNLEEDDFPLAMSELAKVG